MSSIRGRRKPDVTEEVYNTMHILHGMNPEWTNKRIGDACGGYSSETVGRYLSYQTWGESLKKKQEHNEKYRKPGNGAKEEAGGQEKPQSATSWQRWYDAMITQMAKDASTTAYEIKGIRDQLSWIIGQLK